MHSATYIATLLEMAGMHSQSYHMNIWFKLTTDVWDAQSLLLHEYLM